MLCRSCDHGSLIQRFHSSRFGERQTKVQLTLAQDRSRLLFQMEQWDWRGKMHNGHGVAKCHDAVTQGCHPSPKLRRESNPLHIWFVRITTCNGRTVLMILRFRCVLV